MCTVAFLFRFCGLLSYPLDVSLKAEVWSSSDGYKGDRLCMHVQENFDVEDALGSNVFIAGAMQVELTEIAYIENWNWFI